MPELDRRTLLRRALIAGGLATAWPVVRATFGASAASEAELPAGDSAAFPQGVASGDPTPERVVLWTRVDPGLGDDVAVDWEVATDPGFAMVAASGTTSASSDRGHCVKVDASLPSPGATWYYRFRLADGRTSPVGRTRTTGDPSHLRFAATTCTNPAEGELNSLTRLAELPPLDFVLHLGDYIYEFGANLNGPGSASTVQDYRARYADWRGLGPQQAAHRAHPWVVIWDDGDIWNGVASLERAGVHGDHDDRYGDAHLRRSAAIRAFFEWVPCRDHLGGLWGDASPHCHRHVPLGPLADLVLLDTRLEKDAPLGNDYVSFDQAGVDDEDRQIISEAQMTWALERLATSPGEWSLLGSQVMIGHWGAPGLPSLPPEAVEYFSIRQQGNGLYAGSWNGYAADRRRLFEGIGAGGVGDLLAFSGDSHFSMALDLTPDPMDPARYDPATGRGSLGAEFMVPSVSSDAFPETLGYPPRTASIPVETADVAGNPHHVFAELDSKGYLLVDLTPQRARTEFWFVDTVDRPSDVIERRAAFEVRSGTNHVVPLLVPDHLVDQAAPASSTGTARTTMLSS